MQTMNDYPVILNVEHIQEILGVGKRRAYEIMKIEDFPVIEIGRTKRVNRDQFFQWLNDSSGKKII